MDARPAVIGTTGRVKAGYAVFRDRSSGTTSIEPIGENFSFEIRVEDGSTSYQPAGRNGADALAKLRLIAARLDAKRNSESLGLIVLDPDKEQKKRVKIEDVFDEYIDDAEKREAMEAWENALLVKRNFLAAVPITYVDEITRDSILKFDQSQRAQGLGDRTIANKRQRLQSMLRWARVDPAIFPPKPKYEKTLPTIYTPELLQGLLRVAKPCQRMACNLALKLGLRDQEVQYAEFSNIRWHESVFRVRSKPQYKFKVKDSEQRDIPIPRDLLEELQVWRDEHPNQSLIVPTSNGRPNAKLLKMVKGLARRAGIECGVCNNCRKGAKGVSGCDEFDLHTFRRTCLTTWLRSGIDPRTVMAYAGHADLATTLRYLSPASARESIDAVSGIKWY